MDLLCFKEHIREPVLKTLTQVTHSFAAKSLWVIFSKKEWTGKTFTRQQDLSPGTLSLLSSTLPLQPLQPPRPPIVRVKMASKAQFQNLKIRRVAQIQFFFLRLVFFFWSEIFFWKSVNNNLKSKSKSWAGGRELKKWQMPKKKLFSKKRVETFLSRDKLFL